MGEIAFSEYRRTLAETARPRPVVLDGGIYVYGAGGFGRRVARTLLGLNRKVLGFIDVTARERPAVDGLPCLHPEDLGDVRDAAYAHGLMNYTFSSRAVADWAAARGFSSVFFPSDLYAMPGFGLESYWLAPPQRTLAHLDAIEALHDALADDESRTLLRALLLYRLSTDPRRHPDVAVADAYAPAFLPIFGRPLTFIDGGAYTGDTLEALLAQQVSIADWIAFEPDERNMAALRATARRNRDAVGAYTLIQAGLSRTSGTVKFEAGTGAAARIVGEGEETDAPLSEIAVVGLDETVSRSGETYVKLDIEGAEIDALNGMAQLLSRRPTLAVSVYHRPSDLWEIPRLIADLYDRPTLRLRQHGHHGFDTVLYVTPG